MQKTARKTVYTAPWRLLPALISAIAALTGCSESQTSARESAGCGGRLTSQIYGGIEAELDWRDGMLECTGMPHPNGAGARLHFSGSAASADGDKKLAFIVSLPGLKRGETATELPTTITVIEEDAGRFFSSQENPVCWTDVDSQELLQNSDEYSITGVVYCVAPLAEMNGSSSISFADLHFTGQLRWTKPK